MSSAEGGALKVDPPTREQNSTVYIPALQTGFLKGDITAVFNEERGAFGRRLTTRRQVDSFFFSWRCRDS